ncbi:MAG: excinuclease ABC subunit A [Thermodesulfovibrio aggregans]|uniref:UvrABC system protein A n=1 Tax=Thermodesulfovibrio aggregans TaxID=86166 RepID=A0A2J6WN13_9BACT|nr:MAG: excinuclease ABC subunit A [Thermodesulfovibrio aggregans]
MPMSKVEDYLIIKGARQNNLKNIELLIPHNKLTVITGISGSGKSSLAFDTIYAEAQWRFIECMSSYARVFIEKLPRPDVDLIDNLRPSIALEQRNPVKGSRATVGTHTEIYDYLRIIFSKIAIPICPECKREIKAWSPSKIVQELLQNYSGKRAFIMFESEESTEKLIKLGFSRVFIYENTHAVVKELSEFHEKLKMIIVDRLRISDVSRLNDSVEIAFKMGNVKVYIVEDNILLNFPSEAICPQCGIKAPEASPLLFSFNHPQGACAECKGFGYILKYDESFIIPDRELSLAEGAIEIWERPSLKWWKQQLIRGAKLSGINVNIPYRALPEAHKNLIFTGNQYFYGVNDFLEELERKRYKVHIRVFLSRIRKPSLCPVCKGKRLKEEALMFKINGLDIGDLNFMSVTELKKWIQLLKLSPEQARVAEEPLKQISEKLDFLERVGLKYLTLDRQIKTLSGGEYQRLNISNQLSNKLTATLYILDEPTVGLHPRDTDRIIKVMKELTDYGNTVIVVEHDRDVIKQADWIIELGPGGGSSGGKVIYSGKMKNFLKMNTPTANYLKENDAYLISQFSRFYKEFITLKNARGHNLKGITVHFPLNALTVVTGVSGSGKSSLVVDTFYKAVANQLGLDNEEPLSFDGIEGIKNIKTIKLIDQSPIGKTPKSMPVTYLGLYSKIRDIFASQREARARGLSSGAFSVNSSEGQCPTCKGEGFTRVQMYFFEDLFLPCEDCEGKRFKKEVLEIKYKDKNIHEVLSMSFDEAYEFFCDEFALREKINIVRELGLGYLRLGQPATTLSGGEAQRIKICEEIINSITSRKSNLKGFIYILDEPTVGLHYEDIKKFLHIVKRLIDKSATVIIIEHNLQVIADAHWIIDLGPEGGDEGGYLLYEGNLHDFLKVKNSYTAKYLREHLKS